MARRSLSLALAGTLAALLVAPMGAAAQEAETDQLPPYAAEEWEAAQDAGYGDPVAQAQQIPPPPEGISRAEAVPYSERDRGDVQFDDFYQGLADHGTWVETPEYGYVFIPDRQSQVQDWRPYVYGRWIWTDYGWTWVSEEPFGWATYHYGRWTMLPSFGWAWVPGYTWGPAWVAWRYGDAAIGWAPLYPGYVAWTASYPVYTSHWVYIGPTYFYSHPVHVHHYAYHRSSYYHRHTHWASNWHGHGHGGRSRGSGYVYAGPPRTYVERHSRTRVQTTALTNAQRPTARGIDLPGGKAPRQMSVYRPELSKSNLAAQRTAGRVRVPENVRAPKGVGSGLVAPQQVNRGRLANERATAPGQIRTPRAGAVDRQGAPQLGNGAQRAVPRSGAAPQAVERRGGNRIESPRVQQQNVPTPRAAPAPRAPQVQRSAPSRVVPQRNLPAPRQQVTPRNVPSPQRLAPRGNTPSVQPQRVNPPRVSAPRSVAPRGSNSKSSPPPAVKTPPSKVAPRSSAPRIAPRATAPRSAPSAPRPSGNVRRGN
ncbi:DUF6600 domain-containing protein [Vulgatibacter sp.]|uniref:DUF6600 domain-containing protein n=1 Tax=Vulgatibacter sp. TaxID=1971226 RepID=UPI003561EA16